jgi:NAD(P)-dependent dehydrogenase (short-subunit alcohol dehydrogenase family)
VDDLGRLFAQAEERLAGLDIVVCTAASAPTAPIADVTEDDYDRFMAVNARGPFFILQYASGWGNLRTSPAWWRSWPARTPAGSPDRSGAPTAACCPDPASRLGA